MLNRKDKTMDCWLWCIWPHDGRCKCFWHIWSLLFELFCPHCWWIIVQGCWFRFSDYFKGLNSSLYLVPNLDCSLLSISKLTKDLKCVTKFFPNHCEFQVMDLGMMIYFKLWIQGWWLEMLRCMRGSTYFKLMSILIPVILKLILFSPPILFFPFVVIIKMMPYCCGIID